jgi:hypothetical protein
MVRKRKRVIEWFVLGGGTRGAARRKSGLLIGNARLHYHKCCIRVEVAK